VSRKVSKQASKASNKARLTLVVLALVACALGGPASRAHADRLDEAWQRGNDAYLRGDFAAAVAAYEELDRHGVVSPDLAYHLGNAYFRRGELGRAIWSFERALTLAPDDEDPRYNLGQARKLAQRKAEDKLEGAERDPLWMRVVGELTPTSTAGMFLAFYLAFFGCLFWRRASRRRAREIGARDGGSSGSSPGAWAGAPGASASSGIAGTLAALTGVGVALTGLLLVGRVTLDRLPFAIVLPDQAEVKDGADSHYRTSFKVHAGLRVRLLDRDQDWVRLRLSNGLEGWLPDRDVGRL